MPPCPRGDRVRQQEMILAEGWKSLALSPSHALLCSAVVFGLHDHRRWQES